ncbi:hypothetical protein N7520_004947 [Penicillium odoratum]|uniref:uncharacterized protein n=1 Tax=Penicillium odoratum TaxID=1167516 RepID=UPI002548F939|nr:uncharacterized protein N7520_004947 [Penicillium odoratum]KAJ5765388.1 hypothetical protein N7520_004947 [Penicillium odoratum]
MGLSNFALIIIVLVGALASVTLAAAVFGSLTTPRESTLWSPPAEQQQYMRKARDIYRSLLMEENGIRYPNSQRLGRSG